MPRTAFLPATGTIHRLRGRPATGIRVDAGVVEGDEVGGRFDPMLAKIIAHGRDRDEALDHLTTALDATVILGLTTNLRFLRWLVREPAVRDGAARTDTLDHVWPPDDWERRARIPDAAWSTATRSLLAGSDSGDGFRLNAAPSARVDRRGRDEDRPARAGRSDTACRYRRRGRHGTHRHRGTKRRVPDRAAPGRRSRRERCGRCARLGADRARRADAGPGARDPAPAGAHVEAGDTVVILEAMKMEHAVTAPRAGLVGDVAVRQGEQVTRGQRLAVVEPG